MAIRNHLWHWCHFAVLQATTADDQVAQPVQQAVVNIVTGI
jgi:hypothetical protein